MPRTFLDSDFVDTQQSPEAIPVKAPRTFSDADFADDAGAPPKAPRTFSDADFAPEAKPAGALDIVTALPRGAYQGIVRGLPEMVGKATQFAGSYLPEGMAEPVQEFGKAVSESSLVKGRLKSHHYGRVQNPPVLLLILYLIFICHCKGYFVFLFYHTI